MSLRRPHPGLLVTLEGADGTGKSLLGQTVADSLSEMGIKTHLTREPGGTVLAEKIREILLSKDLPDDPVLQMLLFNAARRDHVEQAIHPLLEQGYVVICDRYLLSSLAYQGLEAGFDTILSLHATAIELLPDLMFLVDADVRTIARRISTRPKDEPAGINEWTRPEAIQKRKELHYRALWAMKEAFGSKAYLGGDGWMRIRNDLPVDVAEGEVLVHILRAASDLLPNRGPEYLPSAVYTGPKEKALA